MSRSASGIAMKAERNCFFAVLDDTGLIDETSGTVDKVEVLPVGVCSEVGVAASGLL